MDWKALGLIDERKSIGRGTRRDRRLVENGERCAGTREARVVDASRTRILGLMLPWAWPCHPALGAVLEAARRAEAEGCGV